MKMFFMSNDLWTLVELGSNEDEERLTAAQRIELRENKKDRKALFFIQSSIDKGVFPNIMGAKRAKQAWKILKEEFKGTEKLIMVRRKPCEENLSHS